MVVVEGGGERMSRKKQHQSCNLPAKICETLVRTIPGSDPTPVEERGLGGGGGGGGGGEGGGGGSESWINTACL